MLVGLTCDDATSDEPRIETGQRRRRVQNLKQLALVICQDNARPTRTQIVKRERRADLDAKSSRHEPPARAFCTEVDKCRRGAFLVFAIVE